MSILFRGEDLRLSFLSNGSNITFVSFTHWRKDKHPINKSAFTSFATGIAHRMGFNEFNVDTSRNHWYQTAEILEVIRLIKEHNPVGAKIITYGSSMGAYASINFSELLDAHRFIAISPQFSLAPHLRPDGDNRWRMESKLLNFDYDYIASGAVQNRKGYIFYDRESLDLHQALPTLNHTSAIGFHIPLSGHPCGRVLNQSYGLKQIMKEVAEETFNPVRFHAEFNANFQNSIQSLTTRSQDDSAFEQLKSAVISKSIHTKDLFFLMNEAVNSDNFQFKKLALFAVVFAEIKESDIEKIRTIKINLLRQLKLWRDAFIEIASSSHQHKGSAEEVLSQYNNLTELRLFLPLMTKLHPVSFRDASFKCVKENPERALILMQHASKMSPDNLKLKQKIEEYKALVAKKKGQHPTLELVSNRMSA